MKKFFTALLVLLPLSIQAKWEILNEGFRGQINSFDFVNEYVGWIAGYNGTLLKTSDGGVKWNRISIIEDWDFIQTDFVNETIGWAIARIAFETYAILKTSDGGLTWSIQKQSNTIWLNSLQAINEHNVYAVGGNIYRTTDGGSNWIDVTPNLLYGSFYNSLFFQNPETGIVVGESFNVTPERGIILRTNDGGNTWNENIVNEFKNITDLQFLENSILHFKANKDSISFLCKTVDLCSSWTILIQSKYGIGGYYFIDTNIVYAVVGDSISANNIMKSTDGGLSWTKIQSVNVPYLSLKKIFFSSNNHWLIIGWISEFRNSAGGNVLIKSSNGKDFTIENFSLFNSDWFRSPFPCDIYFIDMERGFIGISFPGHASGGDHSIFSTTDGGNSWILGNRADGYKISFSFINELVGFYSTEWPIYKTTDSGNSWFKSSEFTDGFTGHDNIFTDTQNGWVVGIHDSQATYYWRGRILRTTDGGINWNIEWTDSTDHSGLNSLCITSQILWAVGDHGTIIKYTPQTGWVKQTSVTDLPLNKVFFFDENHGWIAGGYQNDNGFQKILLKTTDGGVNWTTVSNIPYLFRDIAFVNNSFGWVIGYDSSGVGGILKSTDGGNSWTIDTGNLSAKLNALYIKDGYGWAVGENGLIIRTTNAGPTWVENENLNLPTEFVLEQNYPNPFNPTTKIRYSVPSDVKRERSNVVLKVYDVLGRELAALVNEAKQPGVYEIEFDGTNFSSGVYFYQLRTENFIENKKMVLLR